MAIQYQTLAEWENAVKVFTAYGIPIPADLAAQEPRLRELEKERLNQIRQSEEEKAKHPIFSKLEDNSKYKPYTEQFKKCVFDTVEKLMEDTDDAKQPGLLLGRIQCGKTNTFVNIMGYAFDKGIDVAIVLTKGTNALAKQTTERLINEFDCIANADVKDIMVLKDRQITADIINSKKMIIVCKKEDDNLKHLTNVFTKKQPLLKTKKVLVIDDEADFASINYQKKHGKWFSAVIAKQIQDFITIPDYCRYLQVTATPYSLYLQPGETLNLENGKVEPFRPRFTSIVPTHGGYVGGRQYFVDSQNAESMYSYLYHPVSEKCIDVMKVKNRVYIKNIMTSKNIESFRYALLSYMIATVIRKIQTDIKNESLPYDKRKPYQSSCLVHLDVAKNKMVWQDELVKEYFEGVRAELNGSAPTIEFDEMFNDIYKSYKLSNEAGNKEGLLKNLMLPEIDQVRETLCNVLNNTSYVIQVVNSDQKVENLLNADGQLELTSTMNIFIGGSILDRGITIENMLCFFYGRNPKKFQQDTVLQHARMYGNRSKEDMSVTRLHTTYGIYEIMQKMNDLDDRLREQIENNTDASLVFLNYSGGEIQPCAKSKIAISNTLVIKPGMRRTVSGFQTGPKSQIAKTVSEIDQILTSQPGYVEKDDLFEIDKDTVVDIIRKIRSTFVYDKAPDLQWKNYGLDWNENDLIDCIEWCTRPSNGKMLCLCHTNLNASRFRSDGNFTDAPETGRTDLKMTKDKAIDMPAIILLRENGNEDLGWRGTPFYWPVFVAQQNVDKSIFTLDSDTKVKEYIAPDRSILNGINANEVLTLPLQQEYFDAIIAGQKREEYRQIYDTSAAKYLEKTTDNEFVLNKEAVKNEDDLTAGIHSYNNGVFPFVPRKYKYIHFRSTHDAKANQMLVEINPKYPCDFGCATPSKKMRKDTLVKNGVETEFIDENFKLWIICYYFRPLRIHNYGEDVQTCPNEDFREPKPWNAEEMFGYDKGDGWLIETIERTNVNGGICLKAEVIEGTVHVGDTLTDDASDHLLDGHKVDRIEIEGHSVDSVDEGKVANFYFYDVSMEKSESNLENDNQDSISDTPTSNEKFRMPIDGAYWIAGRNGYLLSGTVESGSKEVGDTIYLSNGMDGIIVEFDNDAAIATPGDKIGILVSGIKKGALDGVENLIAE